MIVYFYFFSLLKCIIKLLSSNAGFQSEDKP